MMKLRETTLLVAGGAVLGLAAAPPLAKPKPKPSAAGQSLPPGAQTFQAQCASCHGAKGEGAAAYPRPLVGSQSVGQLAKYIAANMPPGPKHCAVPDAQKVASYIYDAFYSPLAQERNRPARVALSRLTVRQYRNAVADLVGSFRRNVPLGKAEGLHAQYFRANSLDKNDLVIERNDPTVKFDFGTAGPTGGDYNPHQFSIRWEGSLLAPDTGVYDIVVRTDQGMRLWVNDPEHPVLDKWVKSGKDTEYRASLYLVGGRTYPIRLEFSKSTQGVDDSEKKKGKPAPPAFIQLAWKRPKQVEETIPTRYLFPTEVPESLVVTSAFPPDDRSLGYERGNAVSKEWDDATTSAALEAAGYVSEHLPELAGSRDDKAKLLAFSRTFVERALRRPLDPATEPLYVTRQFQKVTDPVMAVKRVVLLTLISPRFLYREVDGSNDPYNTASRLSFALWDSVPDTTLLRAAASGQLSSRAQIVAQAERMASDPRAWFKQRDFFLQWLKVDQYPDLAKDTKKYPGFTPAVTTDLRTSLDLTLESVVRSDRADFRDLFLSDKVFLNGRLAAVYGAPLAPDAPFQPVALDSNQRAGILTHPYILASFAYIGGSSPIHRGVLLTRNLMGRTLSPPPAAFVPLAASLHPDLTTRQRVSLQTKPAACIGCHHTINQLGFTLEGFDAIGKLRTVDNNRPVDTTGSYDPRTGPTVTFKGPRDLARYIATSEDSRDAFVEKYFQYLVKQPVRAYGPQTLPALESNFQADGYNMRQLAAQIAVASALPRKN